MVGPPSADITKLSLTELEIRPPDVSGSMLTGVTIEDHELTTVDIGNGY